MRKIMSLLSLIFVFTLSGCSQVNNGNNNNDNESDDDLLSENNQAMVVYFSATGNTKEVASIIASYTSSPLYELEPVEHYSSDDLNYNDPNSRVNIEHNDEDHITPLVNVHFEAFDQSRYIFLGAPIWWGELSFVINDFLINNDFNDKVIIPFATSSSSNFNNSSIIEKINGGEVIEGRRFRRSEINETNITSWIDSLNISFNN